MPGWLLLHMYCAVILIEILCRRTCIHTPPTCGFHRDLTHCQVHFLQQRTICPRLQFQKKPLFSELYAFSEITARTNIPLILQVTTRCGSEKRWKYHLIYYFVQLLWQGRVATLHCDFKSTTVVQSLVYINYSFLPKHTHIIQFMYFQVNVMEGGYNNVKKCT